MPEWTYGYGYTDPEVLRRGGMAAPAVVAPTPSPPPAVALTGGGGAGGAPPSYLGGGGASAEELAGPNLTTAAELAGRAQTPAQAYASELLGRTIAPAARPPEPPAPTAPPTPQVVAPRPPPPPLPPDVAGEHGGYYYPPEDEFLSDVETRRLRGELTDEQARRAVGGYGRSSATTPGLEQRLMREQQAGVEEQAAAAMGHPLADVALGEQAASAYQQAITRDAEQTRRAQERREQWQQSYARQLGAFEKAMTVSEGAEIDPQRLFTRSGIGGRILAGIAAAAGAFGAGLTGTRNFAMDAIQSAINDDIATQRAALEGKRAGLAARSTLLGQIRQHVEDLDQAEDAARGLIYRKLGNQLEVYRSQATSDVARAKIDELAAALRGEQRSAETKLRLHAQAYADRDAAARAQAAAAAAQARAERERKMAQLVGWRPLDAKESSLLVPLPDGGFGMAQPIGESRTAIMKLKDEAADVAQFTQNLDRVLQLTKGGRSWTQLSPDDRDAVEQLYGQMFVERLKAISGAAVTDTEAERFQRSMGRDPRSAWDTGVGDVQAGVERLKDQIVRRYRNRLDAYGVTGRAEKLPNPETGRWDWHIRDLPEQAPAGEGTAQLYDEPE